MNNITLNDEQRLFVIKSSHGYSYFGYDNAHEHAAQIAHLLGRPDLAPVEAQRGTLAGYTKYQIACDEWARSPKSGQTYFAPGTDEAVQRVLERYRKSGRTVRLILGDTQTGQSWLDECDVVGTIGRSMGPQRVPLLIEAAGDGLGGGAILTSRILAIIDWHTAKTQYQHALFTAPDLHVHPCDEPTLPWAVSRRGGELLARFKDSTKAHAWIAFMGGACVPLATFG